MHACVLNVVCVCVNLVCVMCVLYMRGVHVFNSRALMEEKGVVSDVSSEVKLFAEPCVYWGHPLRCTQTKNKRH